MAKRPGFRLKGVLPSDKDSISSLFTVKHSVALKGFCVKFSGTTAEYYKHVIKKRAKRYKTHHNMNLMREQQLKQMKGPTNIGKG